MSDSGVSFCEKSVWIPIERLRIPDWTYKRDFLDDDEKRRFIESLRRGVDPLHVALVAEEPESQTFEVCDGKHRLIALRELGCKRVRCYNHGRLAMARRKELSLQRDWTFPHETVALAECLHDVMGHLPDAELRMPFGEEELASLAASLHFDYDDNEVDDFDSDEDDSEKRSDDGDKSSRKSKHRTESITCPHCNYTFNVTRLQ